MGEGARPRRAVERPHLVAVLRLAVEEVHLPSIQGARRLAHHVDTPHARLPLARLRVRLARQLLDAAQLAALRVPLPLLQRRRLAALAALYALWWRARRKVHGRFAEARIEAERCIRRRPEGPGLTAAFARKDPQLLHAGPGRRVVRASTHAESALRPEGRRRW